MASIPGIVAMECYSACGLQLCLNNRVQLFDTSGKFLRELKNNVQVEQLPSIAVDKFNHIFAIDYDPSLKSDSIANGSTIFEFDSHEHAANHFGNTISGNNTACWYHDLAIDSKANPIPYINASGNVLPPLLPSQPC